MIDKNELINTLSKMIDNDPTGVYEKGKNEGLVFAIHLAMSLPDIDLNAMIEEVYREGYNARLL